MWVVRLPMTCPQAVQNWKCCLHAAAALSVQEPLQQLRFPERGLCQRNGTGMDSAAIRLLSLPTHPFVLSPWISVGAQLHRSEAAQTLLNTLPQCCSLAVPSQQNLFLWAKCKPYGIMLLKAWKSDPLNFFFLYGLNLCTYESEACFSFSLLVSFLSKASKNQSFPRRFLKLFLKLRKIGKIIPKKLL